MNRTLFRSLRSSVCFIALCASVVPAMADTLNWNNLGTDFNDAGSWSNANPLGPDRVPNFNDIAAFNVLKLNDPVFSSVGTTTVAGIRFETLGTGYTITGVENAFLGVGTSGINALNTTGTNSITVGLLLNFDQSITQAAGGTLNITGSIRFGNGDPTPTTITIGSNTVANGTINFSPSAAEISNTIQFVTHVNATLPTIVTETVGAGITKSGAATLTLNGNNSYNGATIINAGTLEASATGGNKALGSTSGVTVNSGGTLLTTTANQFGPATPLSLSGGTFNTNGTTQSLGALTLTSSSTIDLASGATVLNFGDTSTRTAGTLTINDWSGSLSGGGTDQIIFANALDPTFLSNINFTGFSPGAVQLGDGEIVPVPEPATWVVGAMVLGLIGAGCKAGFAPRSSAATEAPRTAGVSRSGRG